MSARFTLICLPCKSSLPATQSIFDNNPKLPGTALANKGSAFQWASSTLKVPDLSVEIQIFANRSTRRQF